MGQVLLLENAFWLESIIVFFQFWMDTYFGDLNEGTHVIADNVKIHGEDEFDMSVEPVQKGQIEIKPG